jgi:hypothetical protein
MQVQVRRTKREKTLGASKVIYFLHMALAYNNNNTAKINVLQGQGIFGKRRALDP